MNRTRVHILVLALSLAGYGWIGWNALRPHEGPGINGGDLAGPGIIAAGPGVHLRATPCPVKLATGLPCPSCGTTRAVESLAAGDLAGSLATNPLGLLASLALLVFPPWVLHDQVRGRNAFFRFYTAVERILEGHPPVALACIALVLANWGWNILKGL